MEKLIIEFQSNSFTIEEGMEKLIMIPTLNHLYEILFLNSLMMINLDTHHSIFPLVH